jgi:hypothetical protein
VSDGAALWRHAFAAAYPDTREAQRKSGTFKEIWAPEYRRRTLMLMVMNFFQAIGFFGFGNWLPALLSGQGASITHSLLYAFFITLAYPLGCCSAPALSTGLRISGRSFFPR